MKIHRRRAAAFFFPVVARLLGAAEAFVSPVLSDDANKRTSTTTATSLSAWFGEQAATATSRSTMKTTPLPKGLSPFEKGRGTQKLDLRGQLRSLAQRSMTQAMQDGETLLEVEFPALLGGSEDGDVAAKSQFDDFDNLQELDANRDWCVQLAPTLSLVGKDAKLWLVFPDDKETELAAKTWKGKRYRNDRCQFTSLRAAVTAVAGGSEDLLTKPWGSTLASTMNKVMGGDGILGDSSSLDTLDTTTVGRLHLVCQPGNGGPVEDWINVEALHKSSATATTCVVNGALDKVRDGYYAGVFFPALAKTTPFYKSFTSTLYLKPIVDKGLYGWIFRVYPEPWQVVLQTAQRTESKSSDDDDDRSMKVTDTVALVSKERPTYQQAVQAMMQAASKL